MPRWPDPPLADEAITLRPWRESDIPAQLAAFRDPVFQRHSDWAPLTEADALAALHTDSQVDLAIVADRVAGGVSLHSFVDGRAGIGYWLAPDARGRGFATRAVRLLSRWAFDELGIARLELTCGPDNVASQRVAERCGFVREGLLRSHLPFKGGRRDSVLYSLLPSD